MLSPRPCAAWGGPSAFSREVAVKLSPMRRESKGRLRGDATCAHTGVGSHRGVRSHGGGGVGVRSHGGGRCTLTGGGAHTEGGCAHTGRGVRSHGGGVRCAHTGGRARTQQTLLSRFPPPRTAAPDPVQLCSSDVDKGLSNVPSLHLDPRVPVE